MSQHDYYALGIEQKLSTLYPKSQTLNPKTYLERKSPQHDDYPLGIEQNALDSPRGKKKSAENAREVRHPVRQQQTEVAPGQDRDATNVGVFRADDEHDDAEQEEDAEEPRKFRV